jgi:hypothetical protein
LFIILEYSFSCPSSLTTPVTTPELVVTAKGREASKMVQRKRNQLTLDQL